MEPKLNMYFKICAFLKQKVGFDYYKKLKL